jgi:hypothetical protein
MSCCAELLIAKTELAKCSSDLAKRKWLFTLFPSSGSVLRVTKIRWFIYMSVCPNSASFLLVRYMTTGYSQSSHFGYSAMSLNLQHDPLFIALCLPALVFPDHIETYHVWYYQCCLCHCFVNFDSGVPCLAKLETLFSTDVMDQPVCPTHTFPHSHGML